LNKIVDVHDVEFLPAVVVDLHLRNVLVRGFLGDFVDAIDLFQRYFPIGGFLHVESPELLGDAVDQNAEALLLLA